MFGQIGQIASLLKNAGALKEAAEAMQQRLGAARFVGDAGAGQVSATVNGRGELIRLKLDPGLVRGGDVELIEDLICAGIQDAVTRSREGLQKELSAVGGGLDLGGLLGQVGGKATP